jgi:hypothetical protein
MWKTTTVKRQRPDDTYYLELEWVEVALAEPQPGAGALPTISK